MHNNNYSNQDYDKASKFYTMYINKPEAFIDNLLRAFDINNSNKMNHIAFIMNVIIYWRGGFYHYINNYPPLFNGKDFKDGTDLSDNEIVSLKYMISKQVYDSLHIREQIVSDAFNIILSYAESNSNGKLSAIDIDNIKKHYLFVPFLNFEQYIQTQYGTNNHNINSERYIFFEKAAIFVSRFVNILKNTLNGTKIFNDYLIDIDLTKDHTSIKKNIQAYLLSIVITSYMKKDNTKDDGTIEIKDAILSVAHNDVEIISLMSAVSDNIFRSIYEYVRTKRADGTSQILGEDGLHYLQTTFYIQYSKSYKKIKSNLRKLTAPYISKFGLSSEEYWSQFQLQNSTQQSMQSYIQSSAASNNQQQNNNSSQQNSL